MTMMRKLYCEDFAGSANNNSFKLGSRYENYFFKLSFLVYYTIIMDYLQTYISVEDTLEGEPTPLLM